MAPQVRLYTALETSNRRRVEGIKIPDELSFGSVLVDRQDRAKTTDMETIRYTPTAEDSANAGEDEPHTPDAGNGAPG